MCAHTCVSTCVHRMACMHAHTCACILCVCVCASNHLVCDVHTGWTACPSQRCAGGGGSGAGRGLRSEHWPRSPSASSVRLAPPCLARRPLYALHLPPRIPRRTWAAFHRFVKWPPFPSQTLEGAETGQPRKSLSGAASARGRLSGSPHAAWDARASQRPCTVPGWGPSMPARRPQGCGPAAGLWVLVVVLGPGRRRGSGVGRAREEGACLPRRGTCVGSQRCLYLLDRWRTRLSLFS